MKVIFKIIWFFSLGVVLYDLYQILSPDVSADNKQLAALFGLINSYMLYYNFDAAWSKT